MPDHSEREHGESHESKGTNWEMVGVVAATLIALLGGAGNYFKTQTEVDALKVWRTEHLLEAKEIKAELDQRIEKAETRANTAEAALGARMGTVEITLAEIKGLLREIKNQLDDQPSSRHR